MWCRSTFRFSLFVWVGLLTAALLGASPALAVDLDTHTVQLDGTGKIVPWTPDPADGYDHVIGLSWNLLANAMPADPANGLPVTYTHSEYDPGDLSGSGWPNHPAGKHAMLADSATMLYAYSGDPGVIELVRGLLDHQLDYGTTPAGYVWSNVPWSTAAAGSVTYGDDALREGVGVLEPDKVGELGYHGYLRFYELTGDVRYRDAAIACADALAANIRPTGDYSADVSPWPFRVVAQTGAVAAGEELCGDVVAPVRLFDELIRLGLGSTATYTAARADAWSWLMDYGLPENAWANYFEDVGPIAGTGNVNQYNPGQTARYLLEHPELDPDWQTHAADILTWVETTFGGTDQGESGLQFGAPVIAEQEAYRYKMASHTSRFGAVNALYYARTGDTAAKEKAYRALNWATYMCRDNGVVIEGPAEYAANPPCWFSDGHGDYIRHFLLAMGAVPEWAPAGENHLVHSTSVVPWVQYAPTDDAVAYQSFDSAAEETLRLAFAPAAVLADGIALPERTDLAAEGWVFDGASNVLRVRHDGANDLQVVAGAAGNLPPSVTLTSPADAAEFEAPATVLLAADASDSDGNVDRVDFYDGTTLLGSDDTAPYEVTWSNVPPGGYQVTAYVRDDDGAVVGSAPAGITVTAPGLPPPWQNSDVGDVGAAGSASYYDGTFTVVGSGIDIWATADEFHFVYQPRSGDFEISARVASVGNTAPWAMAGVMVRDGLAADAKHAVVSMTRDNGGSLTWREATGGASLYQAGSAGTAPAWVKLRRVGDELTALESIDGGTWTEFASATVALPTQVQVGLAVSAVNDGALNTSTFDNVAIAADGGGSTPTPASTVTPTSTIPATPRPTCTPAAPDPTPTPLSKAGLKCQRTLTKELSKFVKAKVKALQGCHDALMKDQLAPDPGPGGGGRLAFCLADPATGAKIDRAASKLDAKIAKACGGPDRTCGTADPGEETPEAFGFHTTCPDFEGLGCAAPITNCDDVVACVACIDTAALEQSFVLYYDDLVDTDPATQKTLNTCQRTIGVETSKYLLEKDKRLQKCWDARIKGKHGDACPDAAAPLGSVARKTAEKIARAESKKIVKICKACGGDDRECDAPVTPVNPLVPVLGGSGGGDDVTPAAIGFPAVCTDVKIPGGGPFCDVQVSTLADLVHCVDCVTEFKVDCMDAARVPSLRGRVYPCECTQ